MPVSLQIESRNPRIKRDAEKLLRFARRARAATGLTGSISILIESNARMQAMNRYFRQKDRPTDVLSFPPGEAVAKLHSGDIAISADIAAANAKSLGHDVADEIGVLILHGMLHLAGFDHERDSGQMARKEKTLRSKLGLPESLIERTKPALGTKTTARPRPDKITRGKIGQGKRKPTPRIPQ